MAGGLACICPEAGSLQLDTTRSISRICFAVVTSKSSNEELHWRTKLRVTKWRTALLCGAKEMTLGSSLCVSGDDRVCLHHDQGLPAATTEPHSLEHVRGGDN